jgi:hypothetical protein
VLAAARPGSIASGFLRSAINTRLTLVHRPQRAYCSV